jgi:D-xylonolactonase
MHMLDWAVDLAAPYGDAPIWHPAERRLYWSDIATCKLYAFDPATGVNQTVLDDGRPVGAITIQADGALLLFRDQANIVVWRDGAIRSTVINGIADFRFTRFTAAVAGPSGRVFCATQSDRSHPGRLLCLDLTGRLNLIADIFGTPAGMQFNPDASQFYFNDAHGTHLTTWRYFHDAATGVLSMQTPFRDSTRQHDPGAPMGLAVDAEGCVWLSRWGGGVLMQCEPSGEVRQRIDLPVKKPTGLCFGGERLDELYMTTAGGHRRQIEGLHAGALGRVRIPGATGLPLHVSRIQLGSGDVAEQVLVEAKRFDEDVAAG